MKSWGMGVVMHCSRCGREREREREKEKEKEKEREEEGGRKKRGRVWQCKAADVEAEHALPPSSRVGDVLVHVHLCMCVCCVLCVCVCVVVSVGGAQSVRV